MKTSKLFPRFRFINKNCSFKRLRIRKGGIRRIDVDTRTAYKVNYLT